MSLADVVAELLPWAAFLLVADAAVWVRPGQWLFVSWGGRFRRYGPGLRFAGLLPTVRAYLVEEPAGEPAGPGLKEVDARLAAVAAAARRLSWPAGLLLGGALLLPLGAYAQRWPLPPLALLCALLLLFAAVVAVGARELARLGRPRWSALSPVLLFAPGAVHAPAVVLRQALQGCAPLAVAVRLLPEPEAAALLAAERRALELALEGAPAAEAEALRQRQRALQRLLREAELQVAATPAAREPDAAAWCPLCGSQYRQGFERCSDCAAPLVPIEAGK